MHNGILWAGIILFAIYITIFLIQKYFISSFLRYIFTNKTILWLVVIPLFVYIAILAILLLTICKNNALLQNLITTCFGILFTVTIVTYAINRENDKINYSLKSRIYDQIESKCCEYIWYTLTNYLEPGTGLEERIYEFFPDPRPLVWEIPRKAIENEKSLMEFTEELFNKANKSEAVEYIKYKGILKEGLNDILLTRRSLLEYEVIKSLEYICLHDFFNEYSGSDFPSHDPGGDTRHQGEWKGQLFNDIEQTFITCIRIFKGINKWRDDNR